MVNCTVSGLTRFFEVMPGIKHTYNWKIWGLEFHVRWLWSSYNAHRKLGLSDFDGGVATSCEKESARRADCVTNSLLDEAALSPRESIQETNHNDLQLEHFPRTLMLTVLWTPSRIGAISNPKESESLGGEFKPFLQTTILNQTQGQLHTKLVSAAWTWDAKCTSCFF